MNATVVSLASHFPATQCLRFKHTLEAECWFGVGFLDSLFFCLWLFSSFEFRLILIRHCEISPRIFSERLELFPRVYRPPFWFQGS